MNQKKFMLFSIRPKLPGLKVQQEGDMDSVVRKRHQKEKERKKTFADEKRKARTKALKPV